MRVLRDNKDSVMAMLEAFVYDPLISWRLLTGKNDEEANAAAVPASASTEGMTDPAVGAVPESPVDILQKQLSRISVMDDDNAEAPIDQDVHLNIPIVQSMIDTKVNRSRIEEDEPDSDNLNQR